jgi:uncharacterized protein (UPF0335 family)
MSDATATVTVGGVSAPLEALHQVIEQAVDRNVALAAQRAGVSTFARDRLRNFIERVERLEEERKAINDDIKELYAEAKGEGFDVKIMRQVVRLRKMDKADFQEAEAILDLYLTALGMR